MLLRLKIEPSYLKLPLAFSLLILQVAVFEEDSNHIREELIARAKRDQYYRSMNFAAMNRAERREVLTEALSSDSINTVRIKEIIRLVGWPDSERFGKEASRAAWILLQHADSDPVFQVSMLPLIKKSVARGEIPARELAYLIDRLRVKRGLPESIGPFLSL